MGRIERSQLKISVSSLYLLVNNKLWRIRNLFPTRVIFVFIMADIVREYYLLVRLKKTNSRGTINEFQKLFKESIPNSFFGFLF